MAGAETGAEQLHRDARSDTERARESLLAEAIQEIKVVKDAVDRLKDELETQRILTRATRLNVVSGLVVGDASDVVAATGKQLSSEGGQATEDPG